MFRIEANPDEWKIFYKEKLCFYHHSAQFPAVTVGTGNADFSEKMGSYAIKEKVINKSAVEKVDIQETAPNELEINLYFEHFTAQLRLLDQNDRLEMEWNHFPAECNRFWFNFPAVKNEAIYGGGEQFSEFNFAHQHVPLWSQEQGIGRKGFTAFLANLIAKAGGSKFHTYYPQPSFISTDHYYIHIEQSAYGEVSFHHNDVPISYHQFHFWQIPNKFYVGIKENLPATLTALVDLLGKQPPLPDWVFDGMWLAIQGQGGVDTVKTRLQRALDAGVRVGAIWSQDWQGILTTSFGTQLFWDWKWDGPGRKVRFQNFPKFVKEIRQKGIRYLGYINPFLYIKGGLYQEAKENGFLVTQPDGEIYHIQTTTFQAGVLDLTNPKTVAWIKHVIQTNMIDEAGLSGWMADFGEYLPVDCSLHSGEDPKIIHNRYPVMWAKTNLEAIQEMEREDIVFFTRSGYSHTSKFSTLVWAGDQMVNWETHDGLASVIPAALSLGMCGVGYHHSDIGGYTTIAWIHRTKEVFMRWAELAAFTIVMRTHEGNRPEKNWQFDTDQETLDHLARMTQIHVALKPYLQHCSKEYQENSLPVMRPLVLHYPHDITCQNIQYQYLLGRDLLVAPVLKRKRNRWEVYLPEDRWIHVWSGQEYTGGTIRVKAPLGQPPVFYRKGTTFEPVFQQLRAEFF